MLSASIQQTSVEIKLGLLTMCCKHGGGSPYTPLGCISCLLQHRSRHSTLLIRGNCCLLPPLVPLIGPQPSISGTQNPENALIWLQLSLFCLNIANAATLCLFFFMGGHHHCILHQYIGNKVIQIKKKDTNKCKKKQTSAKPLLALPPFLYWKKPHNSWGNY